MQEHDLIQYDIERTSIDHVSLQKIDKWEQESIKKIQLTAETARKNVQKLLDQSKERLSKICHDTTVNLRSSREADDYSEKDFIHWTEQLKILKAKITSASTVKIFEDKKDVIRLINIETNNSHGNVQVNKIKQPSLPTNSSNLKMQEKFSHVLGPVTIEDQGYLVKHTGPSAEYAYIRGHLLYSYGCHTIRFKLEKFKQPYNIFLGCTSSQTASKKCDFKSPDIVGWSEQNQVYENGRCSSNCKKYGYKSYSIMPNDILRIIFDCDQKQIKLFNERLNKISTLKVNINKTPYPWQLLLVMFHPKDCVRIFSDV